MLAFIINCHHFLMLRTANEWISILTQKYTYILNLPYLVLKCEIFIIKCSLLNNQNYSKHLYLSNIFI